MPATTERADDLYVFYTPAIVLDRDFDKAGELSEDEIEAMNADLMRNEPTDGWVMIHGSWRYVG